MYNDFINREVTQSLEEGMETSAVTTDLAFHFETAEADYYEAKLRALAEDDRNSRGVEINRIGRAIVFSIQSRRQNPSVNRVMRFTSSDIEHLEICLKWVCDRADNIWFDATPSLVDKDVLVKLIDAGFYPARFGNTVYIVPQQHAFQPAPGITIQIVDLDNTQQLQAFAQVLSSGFGIPDHMLESTMKSSFLEYGGSGWCVHIAMFDEVPAAVAAMYTKGDTSSIDAMATAPNYRNRGCQTALLHESINLAARNGCRFLLSQVEPGTTSQNNMLRAGFRIAYTKLIYANK